VKRKLAAVLYECETSSLELRKKLRLRVFENTLLHLSLNLHVKKSSDC
jgi:hypothetical protein